MASADRHEAGREHARQADDHGRQRHEKDRWQEKDDHDDRHFDRQLISALLGHAHALMPHFAGIDLEGRGDAGAERDRLDNGLGEGSDRFDLGALGQIGQHPAST